MSLLPPYPAPSSWTGRAEWRRSYQQVVRLPADIGRGADSVWASLDAAWLTSDSWSIDDESIDALDGYASLPC